MSIERGGHPSRGKRWIVSCLAVLAVLVVACGDGDPPEPDEVSANVDSGYVGGLDGTDALVGLVVSGSNVAFYACDGDAELAEYLWGPVTDEGMIAIENATGASVRAEFVDGVFVGVLRFADGGEHTFRAEPAVGEAGTYVVVGEPAIAANVSAGWIIDNDGSERGALRRDGSFRRTPKFDARGLRSEGEAFAMTKLVVGAGDAGGTSVTASEIVSPTGTVATGDIVAPNKALRVPSPGGPIPIPYPFTPGPVENSPAEVEG